ncbi:MAG TPA: dTMP kinase [Acidimicrobiia bacterium]|nr:dTMP kinase [Acidimicrobiia bacterium]
MSLYLAIEGVDGAGKTTVCEAVAGRLRDMGEAVLMVREPGGTTIGEAIRSLLLHGDEMAPWTEALLFAAQRAQLAAEVIEPALARGESVISDRSYYSSLAYQGGARELGVEAVRNVNEAGLGGILPNRVVVLWIDPDDALARQDGVDRIGGEGERFQREVAEAYAKLASDDPERVRLVDAARPLDEVVDEIVGMLE